MPSYPQPLQKEQLQTSLQLCSLCVFFIFINFFDKESSDVGRTAGEPPRALSMGTFDREL